MVEISNKNNNKVVRVSVGGNSGNNPTITPNGDYSSYYSELSKAWAIKMDGMVSKEDYSSKYYAMQSKANAETTENNLNSVISEHEQITNEITEARENISGDLAGALTDIATARDDGVAKVTETKTNSLSEIESAKNKAEQTITTGLNNFNTNAQTKSDSLQTQFDTSISNIKKQETTSINAVKTTQTTAETSITNLQTTAESTIANGIAEIENTKTTAISDVSNAGAEQVSNIKKTGFYMKDDKLYYINADGETKEFISGGGRELLEIYIDPFCDESENKGRIANGQIIVQNQFPEATKKLKKRVGWDSENKKATLNTSLVCTEEDWQAIKTASKLGQCGKFVIDDTAGTIRLPAIININGLTDLSNAGLIKSESLPNIRGDVGYIYLDGKSDIGGCFTVTHNSNYRPNAAGNDGKYVLSVDASKSSSTYQDNAPVQQEAVQYPYVICVNTGVEEAERPINNYQVNNTNSLLECKYTDHILNNLSWLRSQGQYNSGTTYNKVYELILKIYNGTETIEGISVKAKGDSSITDYDFVIDTTNTEFRLPIKSRLASGKAVVGNGVALGITDTINNFGLAGASNSPDRVYGNTGFYGKNTGSKASAGIMLANDNALGVTTDGSKSGIETDDTGIYLYYYVGDTLQNADLINIARLSEQLVDKADKKDVPHLAMPSDKYINLTLNASGSIYTAPADGYIYLDKSATGNQYVAIGVLSSNGEWLYAQQIQAPSTGYHCEITIPVKKDRKFMINYNLGGNTTNFRFIYAVGSEPTE